MLDIEGVPEGQAEMDLEAVGFHYGRASIMEIDGSIQAVEVWTIPNVGVRRIAITDNSKTNNFGPVEPKRGDLVKSTFSFTKEDGEGKGQRPVGLYGGGKRQGLVSLGVIYLEMPCMPEGGDFVSL